MRPIDADKLSFITVTTYDHSVGSKTLDVVLKEDIDNAPTVEEKESSVVTECRKASIEKGLPLYFVYYEETGVFEAYITKTKELFEKRHCSKNLSKYEFEHLAYQYLDDYSDCIEKWIRKQGVENE